MSCAASQVILGGITFDLDPQEYEPFNAPRRGAVHRLLDGSRLIQDRGVSLSGDGALTLKGQLINQATVVSLRTLYEATGATYTLTDFKDNEFVVAFTPGKPFLITPMPGSNRGWQYQMDLTIVSAIKVLGNLV